MHIRASIHARIATFDDEKWKLITLMCNHFAHPANYTDIFAPSCGSIGNFTDISPDKAITLQMRSFNFPVRRLNFYAHVYPFDPNFFHKAQHLCLHLPVAKRRIHILSTVSKYRLEEDGALCLDDDHRWRSEAHCLGYVLMDCTLSLAPSKTK